MPKSTLSWSESAVVALICFGLFTLWSVQAVLSGFPDARFTDDGNWQMVGVELVLALAALLYLRARRFDIASLYPQPTLAGTGIGLLLFVACWLGGTLTTSALGVAGEGDVIAFSFDQTSLASRVGLAVVNGSFEEVFLLGVLVRGLRGHGLSVALGVPLLVRVLYHLYQGPLGVVWVATFGVLLSLAYVWRQDLWPPVLAHILWDIVPTL
ncbi:CPBP family intramembrane glutamic endopeptidase [Ideonella alba]|uniref:CPBP family intramembrane metalloprotease n=1 Tax=Ideonella alba TaxID=2824118 RepID=A0A940YCI5_9BURK|nr:CPBP family intramembrane glutamic endopeptidase [Ideonella alba]MBQ0930596.1 CPBP family intramembrane metalloprotease [Ideonella alba]